MATKVRAVKEKSKKIEKEIAAAGADLEAKLHKAGQELVELRSGVEQFRQDAESKHRQNETLQAEAVEMRKEAAKLRAHLAGAQQAANKLGAEVKQERKVRAQVSDRVKELEQLLAHLRKVVDYHNYPLRRSTGFHTIRKIVGRG